MNSYYVAYGGTLALAVMGIIALTAIILILLPEWRETPHDKEE